jgi:glycosyltransferase involved in cell wall biosynthesis
MTDKIWVSKTQNLKICIFHSFFKAEAKGGGTKVVLQLRDRIKADLWVGGVDLENWGKHLVGKDYFVTQVWNPKYKFDYLCRDLRIPVLRQIWVQLAFLFSSKIKQLQKYDVIIISGDIGFLARRVAKFKAKTILYCYTPPRPFTDQFGSILKQTPLIFRPFLKLAKLWLLDQYKKDLKTLYKIIVISKNIEKRLFKYTGFEADKIIYPPVNVGQYKYLGQGDYYISFARLENLKRIKIIVEAFAQMPDKKLIICSGGKLRNWLENTIKTRNLNNIIYKGIVDEKELQSLVGNCLAGIYIPIDEDFGMTQVEIMSAGKPVFGSKEGGLLETVVDEKTGFLIDTIDPKTKDYFSDQIITENLIRSILKNPLEKLKLMRKDCEIQSQKFDSEIFYTEMENTILESLEK